MISAQVARFGQRDRVRNGLDDPLDDTRAARCRARVPSHRMKRAVPSGYWAARDTRPTDSMASIASSRWPTSSRLLPLCRWNTASVGPLIELGAPSQMRPAAAGLTDGASSSPRSTRILPHVRRRVALEHNRPRIERPAVRPDFGLRTSDFGLPPRPPWPGPSPDTSPAPDPAARPPGTGCCLRSCRPCRCRCLRRAATAGAARGCSRP